MLISSLTEIETVNALALRVFRNEISQLEADRSLSVFEADLRQGLFSRSDLPASAFEQAYRLSRQSTARLGVRTADLLHVAIALELAATEFFTFDLRQHKLCLEIGLPVNPLP